MRGNTGKKSMQDFIDRAIRFRKEIKRIHNLPERMYKAFDVLPEMKVTPDAAWQEELRGNIEEIKLKEMVGRVSVNMIFPYPPGVPLFLPGEMVTQESRLVLDFLEMLCEIGAHYSGYETDIHGLYQ